MVGLLCSQGGQAMEPTNPTGALLQKLLDSSKLASVAKGRQRGALWGDVGALRAQLARVSDTALPEPERLEAIQGLRNQRGEDGRRAPLALAGSDASDALRGARPVYPSDASDE